MNSNEKEKWMVKRKGYDGKYHYDILHPSVDIEKLFGKVSFAELKNAIEQHEDFIKFSDIKIFGKRRVLSNGKTRYPSISGYAFFIHDDGANRPVKGKFDITLIDKESEEIARKLKENFETKYVLGLKVGI